MGANEYSLVAAPCGASASSERNIVSLRGESSDSIEPYPSRAIERKCSLIDVDEEKSIFASSNFKDFLSETFAQEQQLRKQRN